MQLERLLLGSRAYLVTRRVGLGTFKIAFKVPSTSGRVEKRLKLHVGSGRGTFKIIPNPRILMGFPSDKDTTLLPETVRVFRT